MAFIVLFSFTKVVGLFGPDVKFMHVDTNCENVIPEIAFEPCLHRETLKRRKMRESVFSFSLSHSSCRSFHPAFIHASRESLPGGFGRISRLPSASWEIQHALRVQLIRAREGTRVRKSYSQGKDEDDTTTWSEEKLKLADPICETTWDYFDLSMRVGNVSLKFIVKKFKGGDTPLELVLAIVRPFNTKAPFL